MSTKELRDIVKHQASLESLWVLSPSIHEALLLAALRHLHAVIEGDKQTASLAKSFYWEVDSEL